MIHAIRRVLATRSYKKDTATALDVRDGWLIVRAEPDRVTVEYRAAPAYRQQTLARNCTAQQVLDAATKLASDVLNGARPGTEPPVPGL